MSELAGSRLRSVGTAGFLPQREGAPQLGAQFALESADPAGFFRWPEIDDELVFARRCWGQFLAMHVAGKSLIGIRRTLRNRAAAALHTLRLQAGLEARLWH